MSLYKREIKILDSKCSAKTLNIDNIFIHSKYNPIVEAERFIEGNKNIYEGKKHVVVYGLGLGYYVKELIRRIGIDCNIYIFDVDKEVYELAKQYGFFKEFQKDKRVHLYIGYNQNFSTNFKEKIKLVDDIIIINQIVKVIPHQYKNVQDILKDFELSKMAIKKFGEEMKENHKLNTQMGIEEITGFLKSNTDNKPIIVAAAGPSLDLVLEDVKKIRHKIRLFAAARALKPLMENDIIPDMICAIDCQKYVHNQIEGYEDSNIPFCFLNTANNFAVKSYKGPKYMFFNENLGNNIAVATGKSVATAVLDIAIKCNGNPIIFIGQDLAYFNNKYHAEEACYDKNSNDIDKNDLYKEVIGVNGEFLKTTEGLLSFKRWIENKIRENPNVKFINCSKGAKIQGTLEIDIKDLEEML